VRVCQANRTGRGACSSARAGAPAGLVTCLTGCRGSVARHERAAFGLRHLGRVRFRFAASRSGFAGIPSHAKRPTLLGASSVNHARAHGRGAGCRQHRFARGEAQAAARVSGEGNGVSEPSRAARSVGAPRVPKHGTRRSVFASVGAFPRCRLQDITSGYRPPRLRARAKDSAASVRASA